MESEMEFLNKRLQILEQNIYAPVNMDMDDKGRFYLRYDLSQW